jgi:hypothetical protein
MGLRLVDCETLNRAFSAGHIYLCVLPRALPEADMNPRLSALAFGARVSPV